MRISNLTFIVLAVAFGGRNVYAESELLTVEADKLVEYWDLGDRLQGSAKPPRFRKDVQYGCAKIEFTVDGEGLIRDLQFIKSVPDNRFDAYLQELLADLEADASDANEQQVPVRSSISVAMVKGDGKTEIIANPAIAKLCD